MAQGADICVNLWELLWRWCWVLEVGCWVLGVGGCGCCCCFPRLATFFCPSQMVGYAEVRDGLIKITSLNLRVLKENERHFHTDRLA